MRKTESPLIAIFDSLVSFAFNHNNYQSFSAFVIFCTVVVPAFGQTAVLTQHNDVCANRTKQRLRQFSTRRT